MPYFCVYTVLIMKDTKHYEFQLKEQAVERRLRYFFASIGTATIVKAIEYAPIQEVQGKVVYNLGFGDYDEETDDIVDDINSNNGDVYIVFNTVLNTIPDFFTQHPNDIVYVSGSDSNDGFAEKCRITCRKRTKCVKDCAKIDRRINTYRYYVDKNFDELSESYTILGRNRQTGTEFVPYLPYDDYHDILVYKSII